MFNNLGKASYTMSVWTDILYVLHPNKYNLRLIYLDGVYRRQITSLK